MGYRYRKIGTTDFADNLKNLMNLKGMSAYELSNNCDISMSYIYKLLKNTRNNPSIRVVEELADGLGVNKEELML